MDLDQVNFEKHIMAYLLKVGIVDVVQVSIDYTQKINYRFFLSETILQRKIILQLYHLIIIFHLIRVLWKLTLGQAPDF